MRKWMLVAAAVLVLAAAFLAWPFFGLYRLVQAVESRNVAQLQQTVDFVSVRQSLTSQIGRAYLRATGKDGQMAPLAQQLAIGAAASVADPLVATLISPEALAELLRTGWPDQALGIAGAGPARLSSGALGSAWSLFWGSSYGLGRFRVSVPADNPAAKQFQLRLRLRAARWRLVEVELPDEIRDRLTQELIRRVERRS